MFEVIITIGEESHFFQFPTEKQANNFIKEVTDLHNLPEEPTKEEKRIPPVSLF